jgi:hypothetical protein
VGALALGAIVVECLAAPSLVPVSRDRSPWYAALKKMPDAVVFEWPVTVPWRLYDMRDVEYMFRSTAHWRPLLNGYSGNYPKSYRQLLVAMRSFPFTSSLEFLRHRGATVLVVHERQGTRPNYDDAIERLHRDPDVALIGQGRDSGHRLSFFKLLPKEPRREAHAATGVRP